MAYIGKSPTGTGVRSRYYYTATGGETSLSGADDNSNTLVFSDGNYVDVSLNGIALVAGTDYNTSTANTISGLSALSSGDIVEVVVYDIFTVADTVSAKDGGTFSGNVAMGGTLSVTGASTATGGFNVGTVKDATGTNTALTIDSDGRVTMPNTVMVDMWRLATSFSTDNAVVTGWEQPDHTLHANVGSSMSESSGVFTFPKTGLYRVTGVFHFIGASGDTSYGVVMQGCIDGSSFGAIADGYENSNSNSNLTVTDLVNITDTANRKIRFVTSGMNSGTSVGGETNRNRTTITFERITDAQ